jgi:acetylornithine deacetylase/succinyl-diaminopimelate desuccinylase-like protein
MRSALSYAYKNRLRFLGELKDFIRFPSVSGQPRHADDLKRCAAWLAEHLISLGMKRTRVVSTQGPPIVCADSDHAAGRPTVLIYGHYDVQPADPIKEWRTPPFEPVVRDNYIYGRGSCDDKGQMFTHVKALEAYLRTQTSLPVNVKCIFEGEEEIGSPNLLPFIRHNARAFRADVAVMSDAQMLGRDRPAITYALRGGLSLELEIRGAKSDLHSGNFGGALRNPLQVVCEVVAKLHDNRGRIAIPGFYDRVRAWPKAERDYMARVGPTDDQLLANAGARNGWGEAGFSLYERTTIRPSLTVTGISGGYSGPGVKAVIPSRAIAKLNFRLAPEQRPDEIEQLVRRQVARLIRPQTDFTIRTISKAEAAVMDRKHPAMRAAALAYYEGFGVSPVFLRLGGTIPVVSMLQRVLGIPTVLMGFASPDDQLHGPNEKFYLPTFYNGIATSIRFLTELGRGRSLRTQSGANLVERATAVV